MNDDQIRILVNKDFKEEFIKACDGRSMTNVIKKLMADYIKSKEVKSKNEKII